jgi:hypothetical protein
MLSSLFEPLRQFIEIGSVIAEVSTSARFYPTANYVVREVVSLTWTETTHSDPPSLAAKMVD